MEELDRHDPMSFNQVEKFPFVFVLDSIRSMHNVGSIFRTADGFKCEGLALCGYTATPPHREIQKTALGATETVPWEYFESIVSALESLKSRGFFLVALEQVHGSVSLEKMDFLRIEKVAFVLGNEVEGVSNEALELCDLALEIPQFGTKHSFNVSVSAGIVAWEFVASRLRIEEKRF